ncbi:protein mono-ADP-ribosyltransferase PARP3 [Protopterus annectens]|uniref:protein mono-ADP-ribosyltransferase PARP3 n=1 Tax=Protopterus annectens TaxID=7888 RepID=UPI001CFBE59E|nr:protein mono-ADP-ribosyltransferase PARP3 [Protopterus annectens]XP_043933408.1 protein mono-ADP-ribosyltransferase PARP3 [Protopterus annectens]XP_043933409.1 protein mono-ADP-ribosyltransferase PARP3 [Protopterus annectens]XP_043933410.1 protein mono-ADP-ribosyltransferase PARP3 [Protopterus annectens]
MAPKRKAAAAKKDAAKKVKTEPEDDDMRSKVEALKAAPQKKGKAKIDSACSLSNQTSAQVYEDFDCMLNQTNIGHNNNKFYIIQLIDFSGQYYCWNRWGRVGEVGQSKLTPATNLDAAKKDFEKKFKDKTKNDWSKRDNFVPHPGKYTMIEVQHGDENEVSVKTDTVDAGGVKKKVRPCTLDKPTQELISLIFSHDMFKEAMQTMNLDIKKMPLGKLSKAQIAKGFEALDSVEDAMQKKQNRKLLEELSSKFYTIIPHNFGRMRPPVIDSAEVIQAKRDMLLVLADIELAQSLQAEKDTKKEENIPEVPHPLDEDYLLLKCELSYVDLNSQEAKIIEKYVAMTGSSYQKLKILNIWKVKREKEDERFKAHDSIDSRRLLWHGTNVAVVAAILKSGLRIMPHSGGRVGCGIYFASENSKSAGYVGCTSKRIGIMFLNEVALGKEFVITKDDSSLRKAPSGFDCVVARGTQEPDPSQDKEITIEGRKVIVPQGKPIQQSKYNGSYFSQSEYVIYKESQCHIRYLIQLQF